MGKYGRGVHVNRNFGDASAFPAVPQTAHKCICFHLPFPNNHSHQNIPDLQTISTSATHRVCICLELLLVSFDLCKGVLDPVHAALDLVVHARDLPLQDVAVSLLARVADLDKEELCMGIILKEGTRYLFITVGAQADVRLLRTYCTPGWF